MRICIEDGSMNIYDYTDRGNFWHRYREIKLKEKTYFKNYLQPLLRELYNFSGSLLPSRKDNSVNIVIHSKAIILFKKILNSL